MQLDQLIDRYCDAWSAPQAEARVQALAEVWAPGATYTDPTVSTSGAEALLRHIEAVHAQYPGARIERSSRVDVHHGVVRFAWQLVRADGGRLPEGLDVATLTADGTRITSIVGFFGPLRPR